MRDFKAKPGVDNRKRTDAGHRQAQCKPLPAGDDAHGRGLRQPVEQRKSGHLCQPLAAAGHHHSPQCRWRRDGDAWRKMRACPKARCKCGQSALVRRNDDGRRFIAQCAAHEPDRRLSQQRQPVALAQDDAVGIDLVAIVDAKTIGDGAIELGFRDAAMGKNFGDDGRPVDGCACGCGRNNFRSIAEAGHDLPDEILAVMRMNGSIGAARDADGNMIRAAGRAGRRHCAVEAHEIPDLTAIAATPPLGRRELAWPGCSA